ncbi:MAG: hypothetical protein ABIS86_00270 [Streptosporangiaceae bacterium]
MSRAEKTMPSTTATTPEELQAELGLQRDLAAAHRGDELARVVADAEHQRNRADVAEATRRAELDRAEREASASAAAGLARLYREARDAGERTRVAAHMARSGEARALRLERLRVMNLRVLVPVLLGFALWSTTGVQAGAATLMRVTDTDPTWWALWILEPVLIGAVVWVIIARARLASSGGTLTRTRRDGGQVSQAVRIAAGCLSTSVVLNVIAAADVPAPQSFAAVLAVAGSVLAHVIGPVGAAATAHLIGVIDTSISDADPWTDGRGQPVPLLADLPIKFRLADTPATPAEVAEPAAGEGSEPAPAEAVDGDGSGQCLTLAEMSDHLAGLLAEVADLGELADAIDPPETEESGHFSGHPEEGVAAGESGTDPMVLAIWLASLEGQSIRKIAGRIPLHRDKVSAILKGPRPPELDRAPATQDTPPGQ